MKVQSQGIGGVFLERAAAEELASKLTSAGWEVQREAPVGAMRVDLVARRGEEVVFYEFMLAGASAYDGWASQLNVLSEARPAVWRRVPSDNGATTAANGP